MKSLLLLGRRAGGGGLVTKLHLTLTAPWTVACQAPLSMGFSRQECWSGLPFPSPGDLPDPGVKPRSPALQADSFWLSYEGSRAMINLNSILESSDITLLTKIHIVYGFSRSYVWIRELDHNEGWTPKIWFFWIMVLEKILERPLACKEIKPVNPIGNQPWNSLEGLMLKLQYFGHLMWRADSGKDPHAGKDWRQKEKRVAEDEIVR